MRKLLSNLECNVTVTFKMKTHNIVLPDVHRYMQVNGQNRPPPHPIPQLTQFVKR